MELLTFVLGTLCTFIAQLSPCHGHSDMEKLLLISFDGFRWDYLEKVKESGKSTPHFDSLIKEGVVAELGLKNVFVTKTFPNHYALVTGMYEENHGVVGNELYDPKRKEIVRFTGDNSETGADPDDPFWWNNGTSSKSNSKGPEPIWVTNQKDNAHELFRRRTGVMFWPGSTTRRAKEEMPTYSLKYDRNLKNETRIDNVVGWFSTEDHPINLGLLYFSEPDHLGHQVGPDDPRMMDMIVELDQLVGYLIKKLKQHDLYHHLNIIITSDHGMANVKNTIHLGDYPNFLNFTDICVGHSPGLNIRPKEGKTEEVLKILRSISDIYVYTKHGGDSPIPLEYHYTYNDRILDIVVAAKIGSDVDCKTSAQVEWVEKGNHGYNNSLPEMHPFFIARGPAFKKNYVAREQFNSVDVYPLMCHILDIKPGPHDGSLENIEYILEKEEGEEVSFVTLITFLLSVMFAALMSGIFSVAACRVYRITKLRRRQLIVPLNMVAGKVPLLGSDDEEEIP